MSEMGIFRQPSSLCAVQRSSMEGNRQRSQLAKGGPIMPSKRNLALLLAGCTVIFGFLTAPIPLFAASQEKLIYSFNGADGASPVAGLILDAAGNLYGTTATGGAHGCGTVFELFRDRNETWSETVLYSFACGSDGALPEGGLVFGSAGNLYGTTLAGGALTAPICFNFFEVDGCGTVFQLTRRNGNWTKKTLHTFCAKKDTCKDGTNPYASLILDKTGNLYGTTSFGGASGNGTVFRLARKNGMWTEKILHSFNRNHGDGDWPTDPLIFDGAGKLYGTTTGGGFDGYGTVFELIPGTNDKWTEKLLFAFDITDGGCPTDGLIFDAAGNLYGTSWGALTGCGGASTGNVFQLKPGKNGTWHETVLRNFNTNGAGVFPTAGLIFDAAGNLYGTTPYGGGGSDCEFGCGVVFKLSAKDGWNEEVLHRFLDNGVDGIVPWAGLIFDAAGNLYGTTFRGGKYGNGTVFEITP
jgi:uncharacterized repeat protein (TIGR03803 family)